uniref:DUF1869 domain-containing protein n=1 Tax=Hafnia alvei TaxID=569 RepID=UPI003F5822D4
MTGENTVENMIENKGYAIAISNDSNQSSAEKIYLKPMALYIPDVATGLVIELINNLDDTNNDGEGFTLTVTNKNNGVSVDSHFLTLEDLKNPTTSADAVKDLVNIVRGYDTDEETNVCGW